MSGVENLSETFDDLALRFIVVQFTGETSEIFRAISEGGKGKT